MLKKFSVSNFRGFAEKLTWNLANPGNYGFNTFAVKDGLVKKEYENETRTPAAKLEDL